MKIVSVNNDLVKETTKLLKNKYRKETGLFLIEGEKGVNEALEAGVNIKHIFIQEGVVGYNQDCVIETNEAVLSKISDAKSAPKVIAVAYQQKQDIALLKQAKKVILLEGIKDAGNLGTIIRTATAFGIDAIVLYGETIDLYNPKTVRSTVGNLWKMPVFEIKEFEELRNIFDNYERIATLPAGDNVVKLREFQIPDKVLLMFGSEADGLSTELKGYATKNLTIEMTSQVESLNLSVSASIIMYKFFV